MIAIVVLFVCIGWAVNSWVEARRLQQSLRELEEIEAGAQYALNLWYNRMTPEGDKAWREFRQAECLGYGIDLEAGWENE